MQTWGNLVENPQIVQGPEKTRGIFSIAEHFGTGKFRKTTFYDVTRFVRGPEDDLLLRSLTKGQFVKITGYLEGRNSKREDGRAYLKLLATKIELVESSEPD